MESKYKDKKGNKSSQRKKKKKKRKIAYNVTINDQWNNDVLAKKYEWW